MIIESRYIRFQPASAASFMSHHPISPVSSASGDRGQSAEQRPPCATIRTTIGRRRGTDGLDPFATLDSALERRGVRFVLIGVAGANYYAIPRQTLFATQDRDLLLPLYSANLLAAWQVCMASGLDLWSAGGPLDLPLDLRDDSRG